MVRGVDFGRDKRPSESIQPDLNGYGEAERNDPRWEGGIEFLLKNKDRMMKPQIRGLMRAAEKMKVDTAYMVPMVTELRHMNETLDVMKECHAELVEEGKLKDDSKDHLPMVPLIEKGEVSPRFIRMMLKRHGDSIRYVAVGSNDLINSLMGLERSGKEDSLIDENSAPLHHSVTEKLEGVIDETHKAGKKVCMCGEMGSRSPYIPFLISLGLDTSSISGISVPTVKNVIRQSDNAKLISRKDAFLTESIDDPKALFRTLDKIAGNAKRDAENEMRTRLALEMVKKKKIK